MAHRDLQVTDTVYQYLLDHCLREHPAQAALRETTRTSTCRCRPSATG